MIMRNLLALAFLLFCVSNSYSAEWEGIKTITVVSDLGNRIHFRRTGEIANDSFYLPISDWGLDQTVVDEVRKDIGSRFTVRTASAGSGDPISLSDVSDVAASVARGVYDPSTDAYLVILKLDQDNYPWRAPIEGLEVFKISAIFSSTTQIYAFYAVALVDAHTFRTITWQKQQRPTAGILGRAPQDIWADSPEELTAKQKDTLRTAMTRLVTLTLDETLRTMGLAN